MPEGLEKRVIDEKEYEFPKFGARQSLKVLARISKIVGKPLALGAAAMKGSAGPKGKGALDFLDREMDKGLLAEAVGALCDRMDENETIDLIELLTSGSNCLCNGAKIDFNKHYEDRLGHLFKVLWAALEVQYGNFSREFPAVLGTSGIRNHSTTQD